MRELFGYMGIICAVWSGGLHLIRWLDHPKWSLRKKELFFWTVCSLVNSVLLIQLSDMNGRERTLLAIFGGGLLLACITDCKSCEVYQFTWWMAGGAALILLCGRLLVAVQQCEMPEGVVMLLLYGGIQELFFCRFYGRADCHGFFVCAMVFWSMGMEDAGCLIHMLMSFCGLALVQALHRNINQVGNLKHPVPFLPYITIAFWINVLLFFLKSDILIRI